MTQMNDIINAVERGEHILNNNLACNATTNSEDQQDSLITSTTTTTSHSKTQSDVSTDSGIPASVESGNEVILSLDTIFL